MALTLPHRPEFELAAIAATQAGAFTRQQALGAGFAAEEIRWQLRRGRWRRIRRGVYASADLVARLDEPGRHLLAAAAQMLAMVGDLAVSHRSAAVVHGLPLLGAPPRASVLTRPTRGAWESSTSPRLRLAPLPPDHVVVNHGVRLTSVARTVVDVAREGGLGQGLLAADAALRAGCSRRQLEEVDGLGKYVTPQVLRAEKLRQDRLEDCGLTVFRYTWVEALHHPEVLADRFRRAVARARDRTLDRGVRLVPAARWRR